VLTEFFLLGVTAESLRAKRDRRSAISLQLDQFDPKFQVERVAPPPIIFARLVRPMKLRLFNNPTVEERLTRSGRRKLLPA